MSEQHFTAISRPQRTLRIRAVLPAAALLLSGCMMNAKLDGVAIGGWERDPNARYGSFVCDNGYRISIKYRSPQRISLAFNNNRKEAFIDYLDGGNHRYANAKNTLRWQENGTSGVLTYPDTDYAVNKRLLETPCRAR